MRYLYRFVSAGDTYLFVVRPAMVETFEMGVDINDFRSGFDMFHVIDHDVIADPINLKKFGTDLTSFRILLVYQNTDILRCLGILAEHLQNVGSPMSFSVSG